jgi:methylenetetrahydrofolate dehydrogenase (NADP+)/methenyltetrahydrofolate cyclohydrolase
MEAKIFNGRVFANQILSGISKRMARLKKSGEKPPQLAIFYFSGFPAAESFVKAKLKACETIGIRCLPLKVDPADGESRVLSILRAAANNPDISALSVIKPIPPHFDPKKIEVLIPWQKDVEGLTPFHYGRLFAATKYNEIQANRLIVPATAWAIAEILRKSKGNARGKIAVVLGRSNILGAPAAHLLTAMDLTVTLCHSKTKNLAQEVQRADVLVTGIGRPKAIRASWLKKGVIIIDAGTSIFHEELSGDVDFNAALKIASFITPVPGGVGPVTTALLLKNVVLLAEEKLKAT